MNPTRRTKSILLLGIAVVVVALVMGFGLLHQDDFDNRVHFALLDQSGATVTQEQLSGQTLLVFFGFTHCKDVCPVGMARLTQIMVSLDQQGLSQQVTPVFISVDPERDTVDAVHTYLQSYHEKFIGLTGSAPALQSAAKSFDAGFRRQLSKDERDAEIPHSSMIYIVNRESRLIEYITASASIDSAVSKVRERLL